MLRYPLPEPDEVHLWLVDLDLVPQICDAWDELSPREIRRAEGFRRDADRQRYIAQRVALRRLLQRYGIDVGTAELASGVNGKPAIVHPSDIRFNASRSGRCVLIGVARGSEIGVDVEQVRPIADLDGFCHGAMDARERAEIAGMTDDERLAAVLHTWTAKEALLKATGDGLSVDPRRFGFERRAIGAAWRARAGPGLERLTAWSVTHVPVPGAIAAFAVPLGTWRLRCAPPAIAGAV